MFLVSHIAAFLVLSLSINFFYIRSTNFYIEKIQTVNIIYKNSRKNFKMLLYLGFLIYFLCIQVIKYDVSLILFLNQIK